MAVGYRYQCPLALAQISASAFETAPAEREPSASRSTEPTAFGMLACGARLRVRVALTRPSPARAAADAGASPIGGPFCPVPDLKARACVFPLGRWVFTTAGSDVLNVWPACRR